MSAPNLGVRLVYRSPRTPTASAVFHSKPYPGTQAALDAAPEHLTWKPGKTQDYLIAEDKITHGTWLIVNIPAPGTHGVRRVPNPVGYRATTKPDPGHRQPPVDPEATDRVRALQAAAEASKPAFQPPSPTERVYAAMRWLQARCASPGCNEPTTEDTRHCLVHSTPVAERLTKALASLAAGSPS